VITPVSILNLIGNTPLIKISGNVSAKLEKYNLSGSIKDRPVSYMILKAIETGKLTKEKTILDASSGNTGISIAIIAAILDYKATIIMPESMSIERRKIIKAYGANLILTSAEKGMDGSREKAKQLAENEQYFYLNQYSNGFNIQAHYETTGPEIWKQTNGKIKYLVAGMGTGGTLMGISKFLKEKNPDIQIIGVEPKKNNIIQGLKNMSTNTVPEIFDFDKIDKKIIVDEKDAMKKTMELAKKGMFVGMSSGAAMWATEKIAKKTNEEIVVIFPDGGEKYISNFFKGLGNSIE